MEEDIQKSALQLGYLTLKPEQLEVLQFVKGKDVFVVLPTGYRKTIGVLPLVFNLQRNTIASIVVVVTPLVCKAWQRSISQEV